MQHQIFFWYDKLLPSRDTVQLSCSKAHSPQPVYGFAFLAGGFHTDMQAVFILFSLARFLFGIDFPASEEHVHNNESVMVTAEI